uniref:Serine and arginine rich splicing factor 9 n=1 Tax=Callithrix jacchus TaxID=9483 RepID=A0A8I3X324_CALJA
MSGWADERGGEGDGRIYVGDLPTDVREKDLEDLFYKYGRIREIELKNRHGLVPFAFVRFEDPRDAEDAIYGRNGYDYGQCRLRVEFPRTYGGRGGWPRGGRNGPPTRRSDFRVLVSVACVQCQSEALAWIANEASILQMKLRWECSLGRI